jgi:hypothetical protein
VVAAVPRDEDAGQLTQACTVAELTAAEAWHLQGKRARFRIVLDSAVDQEGKYTPVRLLGAGRHRRNRGLVSQPG